MLSGENESNRKREGKKKRDEKELEERRAWSSHYNHCRFVLYWFSSSIPPSLPPRRFPSAAASLVLLLVLLLLHVLPCHPLPPLRQTLASRALLNPLEAVAVEACFALWKKENKKKRRPRPLMLNAETQVVNAKFYK